jgi:hypothetical protein
MRKYYARSYHAGGMTRTRMHVNLIYAPSNITGQPVEDRKQSTNFIEMLYLSSTLMRQRQYIT